MPRRPDQSPNLLLRDARRGLLSPSGSGLPMSRQDLADEVNRWLAEHTTHRTVIDATYVGKLERGEHRWPCQQYRAAFQAVLNAATPGDLGFYRGRRNATSHAPDIGRPGTRLEQLVGRLPDPQDLLLWRGRTRPAYEQLADLNSPAEVDIPRRIGGSDVARIATTTAMFRNLDNRWGGGLSRAAVIAQLHWMALTTRRATCSTAKVRDRLLVALAELADVAAFMSYDVNRHREASTLWTVALDTAREAGQLALIGTTLRELAHQALHLRKVDEAMSLITTARAVTARRDHAGADLAMAETAAYEGWCHATTGDIQACRRKLGHADEHLTLADDDPPPPWLGHLDATELAAIQGHSLHLLAGRSATAANQSRSLLQQAIAGRDDAYARSRTLNLIALSATYFQRGDDLEEGVRIGDQALCGIDTLTSPRSLDRLRGIKAWISPYAEVPVVAEFGRRIDLALADG